MIGDIKICKGKRKYDRTVYVVVNEGGTMMKINKPISRIKILIYQFLKIFKKFSIQETIDFITIGFEDGN